MAESESPHSLTYEEFRVHADAAKEEAEQDLAGMTPGSAVFYLLHQYKPGLAVWIAKDYSDLDPRGEESPTGRIEQFLEKAKELWNEPVPVPDEVKYEGL